MAKFSSLSKDAREFAENIEEWAGKRGVSVSVEHGGVHPRLVFEKGARTRHYVIAGTSSDRRAHLNAAADIRRMFRDEGWEEIVEREVSVRVNDRGATFHNPSSGAASPVTRPAIPEQQTAQVVNMTPPPLTSPDAIHVLGWQVPFVPESARQTQSTRGGRKGPEYVQFTVHRNHWVKTVLRAGAGWPEILDALSRAGHTTNELALKQSLAKHDLRQNVAQVVKRGQANQKPISDLLEKLNEIVGQIVVRSTENLTSEIEALTARLEKAERERTEYKDKYDTIKGVLKDF